MKRSTKALAAALAVVTVLVAGVIAGSAVFAKDSSVSDTGTRTAGGAASRLGSAVRARPLMHSGHIEATFTYVDGSTRSVTIDRGLITAVGDSSVTVLVPFGKPLEVPVTDGTCVRKDGQDATLADLAVGLPAAAVQENGSAVAIRSGRADPSTPPAPDGCGVLQEAVHGDITATLFDGTTESTTYDRGQIDSIGGGKIALTRRDGEQVGLTYDDTTVVREKGETKSVDDLKPGERAMFFSRDGKAVLIRCVSEGAATASPEQSITAT